jgi:hypothetical protein
MKRFSWMAFIGVTLLHICITGELIGRSILASKAVENGQSEQSFVWLTVWSWVWQPILMFLRLLDMHLAHNSYYVAVAFTWSACIGVCFGFLLPRLFRSRHQIA